MKHEVKYDQENEVAVLVYKDHFLLKEVEPLFNSVSEVLAGKKYRQLVVFMSISHDVENRETREKTTEYLSKTNISDVAFIGGNAAHRMIAKVLIKTGMLKISGDFFKEYEEAVNWLKSKR